MNYTKLDARLSAAVTTAQDKERELPKLNVFISIAGRIHTGMLSVQAIHELSDQRWVERLSLATRARLLNALEP